MQIKTIYEDKVFKPLKDLNLPDKAEVRLTVRRPFSDLLDELGEPDAEEDIDSAWVVATDTGCSGFDSYS
jgi:predicted DNA-binding antitoxin AbrB/MazE fold protein